MLTVRAPEYFPRLRYAAAMAAADTFVVADTYQYVRQSYQNRTKVRNPDGWQWVSVPLKGGQHGLPHDAVRIRQVEAWRKRHWKAFAFNCRATPYFEFYEERLRAMLFEPRNMLCDLTVASLRLLHACFGLASRVVRASQLPGRPGTLPDIVGALEPDTLLVTPETAARDASQAPRVSVLRFDHPRYRQAFDGFEPGMTAFDLLFSCGPEAAAVLRRASRCIPLGEHSDAPPVGGADTNTTADGTWNR